ncbi:MAG: hypothetical protein ABSH51_06190 [Solirubrobacteraceae bacterium]|jgi:hypothetical protein
MNSADRAFHHEPRAGTSRAPGLPQRVDARMCNALNDLYAYALALDAERQRVGDRLRRFAEDDAAAALLSDDRSALAAEIGLLRRTIAALRQLADPAGDLL